MPCASRNHPAPKDTPPQANEKAVRQMNQADALATGNMKTRNP